MLRDRVNNIDIPGAAVITVSDNTAVVSPIVDCRGQRSVTFVLAAGTLADADATWAITMDEGDAANLSDAASVAAGDIIGTLALAGFTFAEDQKARKIGYRGVKRYVRLTATGTGNTGSAPIAIIPIVEPLQRPAANPPA